jgi:WD40 repeat protein
MKSFVVLLFGRLRLLPVLLMYLAFAGISIIRADEETTISPQKDDFVHSVAFAPDGKSFAISQYSKYVTVYDAASYKAVHNIVSKSKAEIVAKMRKYKYDTGNHADSVVSLDFSPDGKLLAGGRADGTICLWNIQSKEEPFYLESHEGWVTCGRFSPDGSLFASGSGDLKIFIWDVNQHSLKVSLIGQNSHIECLAFSPDGKILASGSGDGQIKLWDINSFCCGKSIFPLI